MAALVTARTPAAFAEITDVSSKIDEPATSDKTPAKPTKRTLAGTRVVSHMVKARSWILHSISRLRAYAFTSSMSDMATDPLT